MAEEESLYLSTEKQKKKITSHVFVDLQMLPSKLCYIFMFAAGGSYQPYLNVFLKSVGLSVSQAGFVSGLRMLIASFALPCWNTIAGCGRRNIYMLYLLCIVSTLFIFPMPWIAKDIAQTFDKVEVENCTVTQLSIRGTSVITNCGKNATNTDTLLFVMLSVNLANAVFALPIPSYIDPTVASIIESHTRDATFSGQRSFGGVGFGCAVMLAGIAADYFTHTNLSHYTGIFYVYLPSIVFLMLSSWYLFRQFKASIGVHQPALDSSTQLRLMLRTCAKLHNTLFLLTVVVMGIASGLIYGFLFLLLEEFHASKTLMGLSLLISCLSELLILPFAHKIIKVIGGPLPCIALGVFSYFLRFILLSLINTAWLVLPIQILHSIGYGLFWTAVLEQLDRISPRKILMSMHALVISLHFEIGSLIANMIGGVLYDHMKGRKLYRYTSFIYLVWTIIVLIHVILSYTKSKAEVRKYSSKTIEITEL